MFHYRGYEFGVATGATVLCFSEPVPALALSSSYAKVCLSVVFVFCFLLLFFASWLLILTHRMDKG